MLLNALRSRPPALAANGVAARAAARTRFAAAAAAMPAGAGGATVEDRACAVVQRQLDLYNAREVDAYMAIIADDVVALDGWTGAVLATSAAALRPRCAARSSLLAPRSSPSR
jgi:hypothetical protein